MIENYHGHGEFPNSRNSNHTSFGFVDADNVRKGLESALQRRSIPEDYWQHLDLLRLLWKAGLDRCYVFSAVEAGKVPEIWLAKLRASSGIVFKEALLKTSGKARKQEGVDVLLAVEAMKNAARGNMTHCTIFSGDGDLLPLVSALVDQGIFTTVASFDNPEKGDVAARLRDASDDYVHIGSKILFDSVVLSHQRVSQGGWRITDKLGSESTWSEIEAHGRTYPIVQQRDQVLLRCNPGKHGGTQISFRSRIGAEIWLLLFPETQPISQHHIDLFTC